MLMQADVGRPFSAHVIVLGNEKGGSGKSTTAMHVAVALLQAGQRVATIDQSTFEVAGVSHYAEMVREARRQRRLVDGGLTDWIVIRNRLSTLSSRNKRLVGEGVDSLAKQLGFRAIDGFAERVVYREFFPRGLTALDDINEDTFGARPSTSHVTARDEVKILIDALRLPIDERGKRRAAARAEWIAAAAKPLETHDLLG